MELNKIPAASIWNEVQRLLNENFQKIKNELNRIGYSRTVYTSWDEVDRDFTDPKDGDIIVFGDTFAIYKYNENSSSWVDTGETLTIDLSLDEYVTLAKLNGTTAELQANIDNNTDLITQLEDDVQLEIADIKSNAVQKEGIVNNLTDGGADKALSAEMGKELGKHNGFSVELKEVANSTSYIIITDVIKGGTTLKLTVHSSNEGRIIVEATKTSDSSAVRLLDYIAIDSVYMIYLEEDVRRLKLVNYTGVAANISADIQYTESPVYHNLPYEIIGYRGSGQKLTTSRYVDIKIGDGLRNMGTSNVILVSADGTEYNLAPSEYYSISPINAVSLKTPAHGSQSYHVNVYPKTVFKSKGEDLEERISAEQCLFFRTNLFDEKAVTNGAYLNTAGNEIVSSSFFISDYIPFKQWMGSLVISTENSAGVRSLFLRDTNGMGGYTVLYDKDRNVLSSFKPNEKDGYLTWEEGVAFVRISFDTTMLKPLVEIGTIAHEYIPYGEHLLLPNVKNPLTQESVTTEIIADKAVTIDKTSIGLNASANLFNHRDNNVVLNKYGYQGSGGSYVMGASAKLFITGFIAVEENKTYVGSNKHSVAFFDKDKTYITDSYTTGIGLDDYIINVPVGAAYMRLNMYMNGFPTARIYEGTILGAYTPYGIETSGEFMVKSSVLNDSVFSSLESMSNGESITLDFPHSLKTNKYSFEANLTTWGGGITIGRGFKVYNSSYFVIDDTNIIHKTYDGNVAVKETVAHGLTLETFVKVFISENNTDDCLVVVQTLTGTFEYTFKYQYKWNGAVKVQSNGAELTNCKLSATNPTLKKPLWMFGDSYFGADNDNRQMYWLKSWGFIDNVLIQSYAGQASAAAYSDLERCLLLGSPKYIVWCLGMNDDNGSDLSDITTGNWYKIFEKVKYTCDIKGITLILATIPNVRGTNYRNKDAMSDIVRNSGQRYIDVAKAVGSSSEGAWYGDGTDYDYQSTDNVHPTMYGAQAIATQILVDFPEIMQY